MANLTCIAVDDEAPALRVIQQYVLQTEGLTMPQTFRNPLQAAEWLKQNPCDILLLDIQMPQLNGLDFFKQLTTKPVVIFTTAYGEFAADAFDVDAADYLRKPFSYERFLKAIDKARDYVNAKKVKAEPGGVNSTDGFISVKANGRLVKIPFNDILYVEAYQEYIKIFTPTERIITYERMKNMEAVLPPTQFMRVHRSYIVALSQVKAITGNTIEVAGQQIPVSRELKESLVKRVF